MTEEKYTPRYSGPNRSGVCKCGHPWEEHHLGIVMNREYYEQTGEMYVPEECEHYGFNEVGGKMPDKDGNWVDHCFRYEDKGK